MHLNKKEYNVSFSITPPSMSLNNSSIPEAPKVGPWVSSRAAKRALSSDTPPEEYYQESPPGTPLLAHRKVENLTTPVLTPERLSAVKCPLPDTPPKKILFTGFREIRNDLRELHNECRWREITNDQITELKEKINSYCINAPKETLLLLKLLSENFFYGIEPIFYAHIEKMRKDLPDLDSYMVLGKKTEISGPILKPAGVTKLLEFYEKTYDFPKGALSCQPIFNLPFLLREMKEGDARGWATYQSTFEDGDEHIVPVFAVCREGIIHTYVFDSSGHTINLKSSVLSCSFQTIQSARAKNLHNIELYSYRPKRQKGGVECSIYSIYDLKNLLEMHLKEVSIIDCFSPEKRQYDAAEAGLNGPPFYEINAIPPAMMKPAQSIQDIKDYQGLFSSCNSPFSPYYSPRLSFGGEKREVLQDLDALTASMEAHTFINEDGKAQNAHIAKHRLESIVYLIASLYRTAE